jgi:predicted dehydrogenase
MHKVGIAIIGAGLIGKKRADAIMKLTGSSLEYIYDLNIKASTEFSQIYNCSVAKNIDEIIGNKNVNLVIIAVVHKDAAELAQIILKKKNVLIEKPVGRNLIETKKIINSSKKHGTLLFVGFNYRFYPHIQKAKQYLEKNKLGKLVSSSFTIGHSASPGYQKTWKMDKELCGGGVVLDPGVHLIDLMFYLIGKPKSFNSFTNNSGWESKVEDESFIIFTFSDKSISSHHYSLNMAKNTFAIEFLGTKATLRLSGRGGNYGLMKLEFVPRWFWQSGENKIKEHTFSIEDNSFYHQLLSIINDVKTGAKSKKNYKEFIDVMRIVDNLYSSVNKA